MTTPTTTLTTRNPTMDKTPKTTPVAIFISARRWFERTNGHSYHSVQVALFYSNLPEPRIVIVPLEGGYSEAYLDTAQRALVDAGILPEPERHNSGSRQRLRTQLDAIGIPYSYDVADVARRRDLHDGGLLP